MVKVSDEGSDPACTPGSGFPVRRRRAKDEARDAVKPGALCRALQEFLHRLLALAAHDHVEGLKERLGIAARQRPAGDEQPAVGRSCAANHRHSSSMLTMQ